MMHDLIKRHPLLALALCNAISFCVVRFCWFLTGGCGAELEVYREAEEGDKMYYLVAGCVNQPRTAFDFLLGELDGGITFVNYHSARGCSIKTIADQVIKDAKEHNYQARVIGISIGDYVARRTENEILSTKSVAINPEPVANILHPWANVATKVGSVATEALSAAFGWLSVIPFYNGCDNYFSLAFIADQFRDIGFMSSTPHTTVGTMGVIISERPGKAEGHTLGDEFLDNSAIREYFGDKIPVTTVGIGHGHTVDGADEYLRAWKALELEDF